MKTPCIFRESALRIGSCGGALPGRVRGPVAAASNPGARLESAGANSGIWPLAGICGRDLAREGFLKGLLLLFSARRLRSKQIGRDHGKTWHAGREDS